jgi:hypothetical protein
MANLQIFGRTFNDVSSISAYDTSNVKHTFTEGSGVTIEQLNVSAAGTYTAPAGTAYSPVVVPSGSCDVDDVYLQGADLYMSANVNSSGLVTYTAQYQGYTNATVSSGYVSDFTAGMLEVDASNTYQLPTQSAKTITPSTQQQTAVTAGKYTTGAIKVDPIPSQYIIPTGTVNITSNGTVDVSQYSSASVNVPSVATSYLGTNPVKIADYAGETVALSSTPFATWTPSTTALVLQDTKNAGTASLDLANYNYAIMWFVDTRLSYDGSQTNKALTLHQCHCIRQDIYKSPNTIANLTNNNYNQNRCTTLFTSGLFDYYTTSGNRAVAYTVNAVVYPTPTGATFSNTTSNTPTLTIKTPSFRIACNNTYLTAANANHIVASDSTFRYWGELWRVDKDSIMLGMYKNIIDTYNS